jgi:hypothetical protein
MTRSALRLGVGEALALLGAGTLFAVLYHPWYEARGGVALDAWQVYSGLDATFAGLAIFTAVLVVLSATGRQYALGFRAEGGMVAAGVSVALLVAWRIVDQPGTDKALQLRSGAWVALGAGVGMALGGRIAFKAPRPAAPKITELKGLPPLPSRLESNSVPPPGGE